MTSNNDIPYLGFNPDITYPKNLITNMELNNTNKFIDKRENTKHTCNITNEYYNDLFRVTMTYNDYDKSDICKQINDFEKFIKNNGLENEEYIYCNINKINTINNNDNNDINKFINNEISMPIVYTTQCYIIGDTKETKRILEVRYLTDKYVKNLFP